MDCRICRSQQRWDLEPARWKHGGVIAHVKKKSTSIDLRGKKWVRLPYRVPKIGLRNGPGRVWKRRTGSLQCDEMWTGELSQGKAGKRKEARLQGTQQPLIHAHFIPIPSSLFDETWQHITACLDLCGSFPGSKTLPCLGHVLDK